MPEITADERCYALRTNYIAFYSKIFVIRKKHPEYHTNINDGLCFGIALSWAIYFLEYVAKDKQALQIYKNENEMEKFFNYAFIAQRDYFAMKEAYGQNGTELIAQKLNKQEEIMRRAPKYKLNYQCIDGNTAKSIASAMLRNEPGSQFQALMFTATLDKELNDRVSYVGHATTLANYGDGCLFFDLNGGVYKLEKNKDYTFEDLINRMINNITCLRDADLSRNPYTALKSKDHILITLKAKKFNTHLREEQASQGDKASEFKIPRFKIR